MPNKYVDFVSDEQFLKCVKWVCEAYPEEKITDKGRMHRNTLDPFKITFDISNTGKTIEDWLSSELIRQQDKTINNRIGDFHQMLLGSVTNWKNLKTGDETGVDLMRIDGKIFIELKNKHNTINSDSGKQVRKKLENIVIQRKGSIGYWGHILSGTKNSGERIWRRKGFKDNNNVREAWGARVYEIVTGDPNALQKTWAAIPKAVQEVTKKKGISSEQLKEASKFFEYAFLQSGRSKPQ